MAHTLSHTHSQTFFYSLTHTHSLSHTHSHLPHTHSLSLSLTHTHNLPLSLDQAGFLVRAAHPSHTTGWESEREREREREVHPSHTIGWEREKHPSHTIGWERERERERDARAHTRACWFARYISLSLSLFQTHVHTHHHPPPPSSRNLALHPGPSSRGAPRRGTLLIENTPLLGPYSRTMPRAPWWSYGGWCFSWARCPCRTAPAVTRSHTAAPQTLTTL